MIAGWAAIYLYAVDFIFFRYPLSSSLPLSLSLIHHDCQGGRHPWPLPWRLLHDHLGRRCLDEEPSCSHQILHNS